MENTLLEINGATLYELGAYWGKAARADSPPPDKPQSHSLVAHCLDVGAVARVLIDHKTRLVRYWAGLCEIEPDDFERLLVFAALIHDLGKLCARFQALQPSLMPAGVEKRPGRGRRHDALGTAVWRHVVREPLLDRIEIFDDGIPRHDQLGVLDIVVPAAVCHHGKPDFCTNHQWQMETYPGDPIDRVSLQLFEIAAKVSGLSERPVEIRTYNRGPWKAASWWISGFVVLADWLGSNQDFFPYRAAPINVAEYWRSAALPSAQTAIERSGVVNRRSDFRPSLRSLFPSIAEPRPLQRLADQHLLAGLRQCIIVEDVTGSGKTEAALTFAARMIDEGMAEGIYFALPTMATANAMYDRLDESYQLVINSETTASLALAHGSSRMHEGYASSISDVGASDSAASCAAWLAQSNKRALLAPFSVGTIDQALLAVLPNRHQNLRLHGLTDKVLVVDEVHACDEYVLELLLALLARHAAAGGSAILLSATLPRRTRQALTDAWFSGLPEARRCRPPELECMDFPLLTQVTAVGHGEVASECDPEQARTIPVSLVEDERVILDTLVDCADAGGCAVWVRNTVADAIAAWEMLRALRPTSQAPMLFHARFALCDRLGWEGQVLRAFGPTSGESDRRGQILVATQVVEQSLDLDFDLLATDLAPIDLILQRAGRCRRHPRDARGNRSTREARHPSALLVRSPSPDDFDAFARFLETEGRGLAAVYPHHPRLWRTALALASRGIIRTPEDSRALVESVYDENIAACAPDQLRRAETRASVEDAAVRCLAANNTLNFEAGYTPKSAMAWGDDEYTPTRLGEPTLRVRIARWYGGLLAPWDSPGPHAWERSEVAVRAALLGDPIIEEDALRAAAERHVAENDGLRGRLLLPFNITEAGAAEPAHVRTAEGGTRMFKYDRDRGLTWE
ncbi:MAG: CRISPR-associated helicase Cas3' [Myxococcota bacterium]